MSGMHFVIDAMPRTGSTTLASLLSCHSDIKCLVEPFHPTRYGGRFHRAVTDVKTLRAILDKLWSRWPGLKHVWQPPRGWPFEDDGRLNREIILYSPAVIALERVNLLQRHVSHLISQRLNFWIGSRAEFLQRIETHGLPELDVGRVFRALERDRLAQQERLRMLQSHPKVLFLTYEALFGKNVRMEERVMHINKVLTFLGYPPLPEDTVRSPEWQVAVDADLRKWNGPEIYQRMPGIEKIEQEVGSEENGWLFR